MNNELAQRIRKAAEARRDYMVAIRRDIHAHPELSFQERRTGALLAAEARRLGLPTRAGIAETGVVALLRGERPGRTIALRADIDALPLAQESDAPYASRTPGVAHLCGHDAHAAMLLGAAGILADLRGELAGNVKFLFEPAEEQRDACGRSGADRMVEEGALAEPAVAAVFAAHVFPEWPTGTVAVRPGSIMAGHGQFTLAIVGAETHGATPHLGVDAMLVAAQIITALHALAGHLPAPGDAFALNVGLIEGGRAYNLIPGRVEMVGSVRTANEELRARLGTEIEKVVRGIAEATGATYELQFDPYTFPATVNDPQLAGVVCRATASLYGEDAVAWLDRPRLAGETFYAYLDHVPGAYFFLGTGNAAKGTAYPSHHPRFAIDEDALPVGAAVLAACALAFLAGE